MGKVLITGASGFIGSRTAIKLRDYGIETVGVGRRQLPLPNYLSVDLSKPLADSLGKEVADVDVIIHGAARSSPWGTAREFHNDNVVATRNMMQLARSISTSSFQPKLVFVSSSSVYYEPRDQFDITEETPQAKHPVNRYAATKQEAERLVRDYPGPWCILRPRAVYGVGDTVLFPRILAAAKANRLPLLVRSGEPAVGDLLSIDNLTDCLVKTAIKRDLIGEFNLTDNEPISIIDFLLHVFQRLSIAEPTRKVSVEVAFRMAWLIEHVYAYLMPRREPPITRFGVHVFAYSKTFCVDKMLDAFGVPSFTVQQSVDRFIDWVKQHNPYNT